MRHFSLSSFNLAMALAAWFFFLSDSSPLISFVLLWNCQKMFAAHCSCNWMNLQIPYVNFFTLHFIWTMDSIHTFNLVPCPCPYPGTKHKMQGHIFIKKTEEDDGDVLAFGHRHFARVCGVRYWLKVKVRSKGEGKAVCEAVNLIWWDRKSVV